MAGFVLDSSSVLVFMDRESETEEVISKQKKTKKKPISSHLDRTSLVNKGFMEIEHYFVAGHSG